MPGKWKISPIEIDRRRREKGLKLSSGVTEYRQADGTAYYSVRSESVPSKLYKVEWDRYKSRWVCRCPDSFHHQATQYSSGPNPYRCAHEHAVAISLDRGLIHGVDSLTAARQRFRDGGVKEALREMASVQESRHQNSTRVLRRRTSRGRR